MQIAATSDINNSGTPDDYLVAEQRHERDRFTDYGWLPEVAAATPLPVCPQVCPRDKLRLALGEQLIDLAILFIVLHEEAHYACGHLHLLQQLGLDPQLAEQPTEQMASSVAAGSSTFDLRKRLELEADSAAIISILMSAQDHHVLRTSHLGSRMTSSVWQDLAVLAACTLCCQFELSGRRRNVRSAASTHPCAGCRTLNLLQAVRQYHIASHGAEPGPDALRGHLENLSILSVLLDAAPVDMSDLMSGFYKGCPPVPDSPGAEYVRLVDTAEGEGSKFREMRDKALRMAGILEPQALNRRSPKGTPVDIVMNIPVSFADLRSEGKRGSR